MRVHRQPRVRSGRALRLAMPLDVGLQLEAHRLRALAVVAMGLVVAVRVEVLVMAAMAVVLLGLFVRRLAAC